MHTRALHLLAQLSPEWLTILSKGGAPAVIVALCGVVVYLSKRNDVLHTQVLAQAENARVHAEAHGNAVQVLQAAHTTERLADMQRLIEATTRLGDIAETLREQPRPARRKND